MTREIQKCFACRIDVPDTRCIPSPRCKPEVFRHQSLETLGMTAGARLLHSLDVMRARSTQLALSAGGMRASGKPAGYQECDVRDAHASGCGRHAGNDAVSRPARHARV